MEIRSPHLLGIYIVIFAIVMMLSSALISYFLVMKNQPILASLKMESESKQILIRDISSNINTKESQANTLVLISLFSNQNNQMAMEVKNHYLKQFPELNSNASVFDILSAVEQETVKNIEIINSLYIDQIAAQNKISSIEQSNSIYSNIAFFLQGLGLLLIILKRDIIERRGQNTFSNNTLKNNANLHQFMAVHVFFTDDIIGVRLSDGREVHVPLEFYPRLKNATKQQREDYKLIGLGTGIHWEGLDEDLSVKGIVLGSSINR